MAETSQGDDVALVIDGREWRGWTAVTIERYIDAMAGAFRLELTTRWPGISEPRPIAPGLAAQVTIGGETVITGRIRDVQPAYDRASNGVAVAGSDLTQRLIDFSALPAQYTGLGLAELVGRIVAPFGIDVLALAPLGEPLARFVVEDGETAFDAIERACRARGVLPLTNAAGQLTLVRAGETAATAAVRGGWGGNVEAAQGQFTDRDRASEYIVKAQRPRIAGDEDETSVAHIVGTAVDETVVGYAPMIIVANDPLDQAEVQARAQWERSIRRGRARRATVTLSGWRDADGRLWQVNTRVPYRDDILGIDAELLVAGVQLSRSDQGTTAILDLADPAAFTPDPTGEIEIGWGGAVPPTPVARPKW